MYKEKFAENLKNLINGQPVPKIAKAIGIPTQTLYDYIRCKCEIKIETLAKIADYFDEDIDFLIGRKL